MSPLRAFRAAPEAERTALVACLRRKAAGVASATREERLVDQAAYAAGLTAHEYDERGVLTERVVPTVAGRVWLAAAALAEAMSAEAE